MEKRRFTYREGALLLILLILAAGLYLWSLSRPAGGAVIIEQNGAELYRIPLSSLTEPEILEINGTVIEVSESGARFVSSTCPDQVCMQAGLCTRAGQSAVCLPQRVSLRITGDTGNTGGTDAATG